MNSKSIFSSLRYIGQSKCCTAKLKKVVADDLSVFVWFLDEKPKSLRSQLESEVKSVFYDLRKAGQEIIGEFSSYTNRFKNDCEEWRARAYFTYLLVGIIAGIGITLLILGMMDSHGS